MACLVWDSPEGRKVFELDRAVMVAGRDPVSDVHLADATVSRRHALLQVDGDRVRITDLGSTSSTRINGAALVRDIPSTLEAGDILHLGKLQLTFHTTLPPAPAAPARAAAAPPKPSRTAKPAAPAKAAKPAKPAAPAKVAPDRARRAAPAPGGGGPWKPVAIGLAFVVVALLGAFLALHGNDRESPVVIAEPPAPVPDAEPGPGPGPEPDAEAADQDEPADEPGPAVERGPAGALPPAGYAPVDECADLLEVAGGSFFVVTVVSFDAGNLEVRGHDGKVYTLPRRRVARLSDRADLVRRVAIQRAGFAPDDAESRLQLARWCAERYVPGEALQLVKEALVLRPDDESARALMRELENTR